MEIYKNKDKTYFSNVRFDLVQFIAAKPGNKVLEVGAGGGDTLVSIKSQALADFVVGIELNKVEGSNQDNPLIDRFIFGNIESMEIDLPQNHFDYILIGDVLEHLIDPWKVIEKVQRHLAPGGKLVVSIPNFRHYTALIQVYLKGSFAYNEFGLFDKTHLRFFCKQDMIRIFCIPQLEIKSVSSILHHLPPSKIGRLNNITLRIFEEFLSKQFLICAEKK
jgi:2-polyprenyl-3-methyl-5-hydroxy-6-metoxy-1,4-benzoquinol methylase